MVANAHERIRAAAPTRTAAIHVDSAALAAVLLFLVAVPQVLLWHFLGLVSLGPTLCLAAAAAATCWWLARRLHQLRSVRLGAGRLLVCLTVAAMLVLLGGEGRLFYATPDWQVRGAVLRDLVEYPWPWTYRVAGGDAVLRAPLGMYLLPALAGKLIGVHGAEWVLAAQNGALLTLLFALGSQLFAAGRPRWTALGVFVAFSGMDIVGTLMAGKSVMRHLEWWNAAQFSSHVTQIFWVPQHCIAGWTGALLFLLFRRGLIPLTAFLAPLPLLALWSPLALMGVLPFAAFAAIDAVVGGRLARRDVVLSLASLAIALPGLLYLAADSGAVGSAAVPLPLNRYLALELIECVPILLAVAILRPRAPFGGITLLIVAAVLLTVPLGQIGHAADFGMRASIPALAILAIGAADVLGRATDPARSLWRRVLLTVLVVGAATPLSEVLRAVALPPAPRALCSYFGVVPAGASTYVAPLSALSPQIAPAEPTRVTPREPARCWDGPWPDA